MHSKTLIKKLIVSVIILMTTACVSPSVQHRPLVSLESIAPNIGEQRAFNNAVTQETDVISEWWSNFNDPLLTELVREALRENRDIRTAYANLQAANAMVSAARLGGSFSTETSVVAERERASASNQDSELNVSGALAGSWELDAFGRINSQIRVAKYNRERVLEAQRDIAVLVASQTAQAYVDLRGAQQRLAVAEQNAKAQAEALSLIQDLVNNGRSSNLDLNRAETLYRTTLASLPLFQASVQTAVAQISALIGLPAYSASEKMPFLEVNGNVPSHDSTIITGAPLDLIIRRPDIRLAQADFSRRFAFNDFQQSRVFPRFVFNANISKIFRPVSDPGSENRIGFSIGPSISWEGPDLRAVRADINISDAEANAAVFQYQQIVLNALSDVEISLAKYGREIERRSNLTKASGAAKNALELARIRFDEGYDNFLDVLDAQRTLLGAQDAQVQNNILITSYAISVYRALGGMWTQDQLNKTHVLDSGANSNEAKDPK